MTSMLVESAVMSFSVAPRAPISMRARVRGLDRGRPPGLPDFPLGKRFSGDGSGFPLGTGHRGVFLF